ncbi:MAG: hypothetical protein AVDCRST_MAG54-624 [uncultured Actinomycetospora sp.]|uniref:Uncharacterized protein n=1 Tax=uncultured Actinomycetospora sp. TaxID=1135996 RepID=A0A6J4HIM8_9PSEU|nr:MAG: hypothetical protein AVDCRST_MAG54-624 [uncultured Actinomycetospora sp.]
MLGAVEHGAQVWRGGGHAGDDEVVERAGEAGARDGAVGPPGVDLAEQRVVCAGHRVAGLDPEVAAHPRPGRQHEPRHPARRRAEALPRVLGRDPGLDRVPVDGDRPDDVGERFPGRDPQLGDDEVHAGDQLGDRVLDLQTGVHLEERGGAGVAVEQELDGAGAAVTDGEREPAGRVVQLRAQRVGQIRGGRLLEQLLVTPLDGAVPVAEHLDRAVAVGEHLHLDVTGPGDVALEEHLAPSERRRRLAGRGGQGAGELVGPADEAHPAPAPAVRRLDQQREPGRRGGGPGVGRVHRGVRAVEDRHAAPPGQGPRPDLVAHRRDDLGRRSDEREPRRRHRRREPRVLGEQPVARVHGPRPVGGAHPDDRVDIEVGRHAHRRVGHPRGQRPRVGVGVDHDRALPQLTARAHDAHRDLAPVRDQHRPALGTLHGRPPGARRRRVYQTSGW